MLIGSIDAARRAQAPIIIHWYRFYKITSFEDYCYMMEIYSKKASVQ